MQVVPCRVHKLALPNNMNIPLLIFITLSLNPTYKQYKDK